MKVYVDLPENQRPTRFVYTNVDGNEEGVFFKDSEVLEIYCNDDLYEPFPLFIKDIPKLIKAIEAYQKEYGEPTKRGGSVGVYS